jgi:hypothetical protein
VWRRRSEEGVGGGKWPASKFQISWVGSLVVVHQGMGGPPLIFFLFLEFLAEIFNLKKLMFLF